MLWDIHIKKERNASVNNIIQTEKAMAQVLYAEANKAAKEYIRFDIRNNIKSLVVEAEENA